MRLKYSLFLDPRDDGVQAECARAREREREKEREREREE